MDLKRDEEGASLDDVARLDTMVTVVDAVNLLRDYSSHDFLKDRGEALEEEDERSLVNLPTEQIEFADAVVLNKVSDAGPERTDAARVPEWECVPERWAGLPDPFPAWGRKAAA